MDLETLSNSIHKNVAAWLFVFVACAAAAVFFFQQYSELYAKKNELDLQVKSFYDLKSDKEQLLLKREKELYQQEINVENEKDKYAKKLSELEAIKRNYEALNAELKLNANNYSIATQRQTSEDKLRILMSEFSAMGINLNRIPECNDKDSWKQYNAAKAKLSQAKSFAIANGLYPDYQGFFNANASMIISNC